MIFLTVGTQIPFDRLLRMMDEAMDQLPAGEEVVAQSCGGEYTPVHFRTVGFIAPAEFERLMQRSDLVVAHAGIGTILSAIERRKPLVVVPRLASLGEHRNDHQQATADYMARQVGLSVATDTPSLLHAIKTAQPPHASLQPANSLINALRKAIDL